MTILLAEQNVKFALVVSSQTYIMEKGTIVYHNATATIPSEIFTKYLGL